MEPPNESFTETKYGWTDKFEMMNNLYFKWYRGRYYNRNIRLHYLPFS